MNHACKCADSAEKCWEILFESSTENLQSLAALLTSILFSCYSGKLSVGSSAQNRSQRVEGLIMWMLHQELSMKVKLLIYCLTDGHEL